jgi:hypothetical protein
MHASFGKRGLRTAAAPALARVPATSLSRSPLPDQIRGLTTGVALTFMGILVCAAVMEGFGRALEQTWIEVHTCVPAPTYSTRSNPDDESSGTIELNMLLRAPSRMPASDC